MLAFLSIGSHFGLHVGLAVKREVGGHGRLTPVVRTPSGNGMFKRGRQSRQIKALTKVELASLESVTPRYLRAVASKLEHRLSETYSMFILAYTNMYCTRVMSQRYESAWKAPPISMNCTAAGDLSLARCRANFQTVCCAVSSTPRLRGLEAHAEGH